METVSFRSSYYKKFPYLKYSFQKHFAFITGLVFIVVLVSVLSIKKLQLFQITLFIVFIIGLGIVEYFIHRFVLHKRNRLTRWIYQEHAFYHHRFFTQNEMCYEKSRDLHRVLFLPIHTLVLFALALLPMAVVFGITFGKDVGALFMIASTIYYLAYEILHCVYHSPGVEEAKWPQWLINRCMHHRIHHDLTIPQGVNFALVFPWLDVLFRTSFRAPTNRPLSETRKEAGATGGCA